MPVIFEYKVCVLLFNDMKMVLNIVNLQAAAKRHTYLFLTGAICFIASCVSTPPEMVVDPEDWIYEERAIHIEIKAPADLNSLNGRPHSLAMGVFQLNDPNTFNGLATTREGAVELLQKGRIDDSVANFKLINIRPGEQKKVSINRAQTAQYVGVIAGYYNLNPKKDVRMFPIPLRALKRGLIEEGLVALSMMEDEVKAVPDKLNIYTELGRTSSKQINVVAIAEKEAKKVVKQEEKDTLSWFDKVNKEAK